MSEQTDLFRSRVSHEWQTVEEIAGSPSGTRGYRAASRTMLRMERDGEAERSWTSDSHPRTLWRLVRCRTS